VGARGIGPWLGALIHDWSATFFGDLAGPGADITISVFFWIAARAKQISWLYRKVFP
jgi:hypothetical protein